MSCFGIRSQFMKLDPSRDLSMSELTQFDTRQVIGSCHELYGELVSVDSDIRSCSFFVSLPIPGNPSGFSVENLITTFFLQELTQLLTLN